jgi:hypothetical protein
MCEADGQGFIISMSGSALVLRTCRRASVVQRWSRIPRIAARLRFADENSMLPAKLFREIFSLLIV